MSVGIDSTVLVLGLAQRWGADLSMGLGILNRLRPLRMVEELRNFQMDLKGELRIPVQSPPNPNPRAGAGGGARLAAWNTDIQLLGSDLLCSAQGLPR